MSQRSTVIALCDDLLSVTSEQMAAYKALQRVANVDPYADGSHEIEDLVKIGKRKMRFVRALEALTPLDTARRPDATPKQETAHGNSDTTQDDP